MVKLFTLVKQLLKFHTPSTLQAGDATKKAPNLGLEQSRENAVGPARRSRRVLSSVDGVSTARVAVSTQKCVPLLFVRVKLSFC